MLRRLLSGEANRADDDDTGDDAHGSRVATCSADASRGKSQTFARLAAQMPVEEKARRSQYVIRNDGTAEELRAEAQKLIDWLSTTNPA